jgi:2-dehydropantoate 2-reductase
MIRGIVARLGRKIVRICVVGAGAMGGLYGGRLALAGHDVSFVDANPATVEEINANGLHLDGIGGDHRIRAPAASDPDGVAKADVVLFHTGTNHTRAGAGTAARVLAPEGFVVCMQNGIGNVEILSEVVGAERVVGGISYHSAASPGPGHATHTNDGATWIGEIDGRDRGRLQPLCDALRGAGMQAKIVDNIMAVIWTKFVLNCAINPVSAMTGLRLGEIGEDEAATELQDRVMEEILAVVAAKGIELTDPDIAASVRKICRGGRYNRPSMQQHMEDGRPTEIDSLNGAVVREGRALGVPTPYNDALTLMVKARNRQMIRALHEPPRDYEALEKAAAG